MAGSSEYSSAKIPLDGICIPDDGDGDHMCSSEYSLVSDSETLANKNGQSILAFDESIQQQTANMSKEQESSISDNSDLVSVPIVETSDGNIILPQSETDAVSHTANNHTTSMGASITTDTAEESFEVISKVDIDGTTEDEDSEGKNMGKGTEACSRELRKSSITESAEEKWMYVLGHQKLKKKVVQAGDGHLSRPMYSQLVTIRCRGMLKNGSVVDDFDRLQFTIGDGDVIQALDLCLPMMELHEKSIIETDSKYAYGDKGREPDVPAGAHITYEVELLSVEDQSDLQSLPFKLRIERGVKKRERGNWWYSRTDYSSAINSYNKALALLDECGKGDLPDDIKVLTEERVKCHNNLGAAQLKLEAWQAAIKSCDAVLKYQPENVKALFRKGKCLAANGDIDTAVLVLRESLKLEPESKLIHNELSRLVNKQKNQNKSAKEMYQRMLGTDKSEHAQQEGSDWKWYVGGAAVAALASVGIAAYKYM